jgi:hypothetical protein
LNGGGAAGSSAGRIRFNVYRRIPAFNTVDGVENRRLHNGRNARHQEGRGAAGIPRLKHVPVPIRDFIGSGCASGGKN